MNIIKGLFGSKKFVTAVIAVAAQVALQLGWEIDEAQAFGIVSPLLAYILGQGIADAKKPVAV